MVAQNTGAFLETPNILVEQHTVATHEDADAYLARLEAYAGTLDGETGCLNSAAAQGVIAPDFVLDKTLAQLRMARSGIVETWPMIASFTKKTAALQGDYTRQAAKVTVEKIVPAMSRQIAELEAHRKRATADAGVWKLPDGEAKARSALLALALTTPPPA